MNVTSPNHAINFPINIPWLKYLAFPFLFSFNVLLILPYLLLIPLQGVCLLIGKGLSLLSLLPGINWLSKGFDSFCLFLTRKLMKDERDVPFIKMMFITPLVIGILVWQLISPQFNWGLVILYYICLFGPNKFYFYFRFFVCKHIECHRVQGFYRKPYKFLNRYFECFLGLLYGSIPELDRCGHVGMHHAENNKDTDILNPFAYDRSNLLQFFQYILYGAFWHHSGIGILVYFYQNKKWKLFHKMARSMTVYYSLMAFLLLLNPLFGFVYFVLPYLFNNAISAVVDWTWHSFADPNDPNNYYIGTITILDGTYNILNEDYHLSHHINPAQHWTESHLHYLNNQELYKAKNASIFKETDLLEMFLLMTVFKRFDLLAKHYVDLTNQLSHEEIVKLLKERIRPIKPQ